MEDDFVLQEVTRKEHVQVDDRRLLQRLRVTNPTPQTLKTVLFDQLSSCIVKALDLEFRIEPVLEYNGDEVDAVATGDVTITLRCHSWGDITKGGLIGKEKEGKD